MDQLSALLNGDAFPLVVLAVIVVEGLVLFAQHRRSRRGPAPALVISFLGAGFALVIALYFHRRAEQAPLGFALAMLAALALHVWHLVQLARR